MKLFKFISILVLAAIPSLAFAHSATLGFTKSSDDTGATGSGYSAWRMSGSCPASVTDTAGFTKLNATLFTGNSFVDSTVTAGNWCYVLTFTANSASSVPSNTAAGVILPAPPTSVTITGSN